MGLFCLSASDSIEDRIKGAIANLQLFLKNPDCPYLLDFAENYIKQVRPEAEAVAESRQEDHRKKANAWLKEYEAEQRRLACLANLMISKSDIG